MNAPIYLKRFLYAVTVHQMGTFKFGVYPCSSLSGLSLSQTFVAKGMTMGQ